MLRTRLARLIVVAAVALAALASVAPAGSSATQQGMRDEAALERPLLGAINALRAKHGLPRLRYSQTLARAANFHSTSMGRLGYFSHTSRDGTAFDRRVQRFYRPGPGRWSIGENLLWASPTVTPAEAIQMWLDSPSHRRILLTRGWREVGIGAVRVNAAPGMFAGMEVVIVTADFGSRA